MIGTLAAVTDDSGVCDIGVNQCDIGSEGYISASELELRNVESATDVVLEKGYFHIRRSAVRAAPILA